MNSFTKKDSSSGKGVSAFSLTSLLSAKHGRSELIIPLAVLFVFVLAFVVVLPRLTVFSHVVEIDPNGAYASASDISIGEENAQVTTLQKNLFVLKYLAFEDISGEFDSTTLEALNRALTSNGKETVANCTDETFNFIAGLVNGDSTVSAEIVPPATTTTTAAPVIKQIKVTAASTKLRQHARENSLPLFLLIKGDTYDYVEQETDAGGNLWYKVVYSPECNGWVNAKDAECIYG